MASSPLFKTTQRRLLATSPLRPLTHLQSIFELADQWVDNMNASSYEEFLYHLLWEIASEWYVVRQGSNLFIGFVYTTYKDECENEQEARW